MIISCEVWCEMLTQAKVPVVLLTTFAQSKCQHSENGKYLVSTNMKIILTSETLGGLPHLENHYHECKLLSL